MKDRLIKLVEDIQPENKTNTLDSIETLLLEHKEIKEESKAALKLAITKNHYESYPEVIPLLEKYAGKISRSELNLELHEAIKLPYSNPNNSRTTKVKGLIKAGADINSRDGYDNTPLHTAVGIKHVNLIKIICEAGPSQKTLNGNADKNNSLTSDLRACNIEYILTYYICHFIQQDHFSSNATECMIIKSLVNAGAHIQPWAIFALRTWERAKHDAHKEFLYTINFLEEKEQEAKKIQQYAKNKRELTKKPGNELELYSFEPEEKATLEDIYYDFQLKSLSLGPLKRSQWRYKELIRLSFLNQEPSQELLTRIQINSALFSESDNKILNKRFHKVFKEMIKFIKNYTEKDSLIIKAILNLIKHLQNANQQSMFARRDKNMEKEVILSYCLEYPEIQNALLKFAPFEQCRLLKETDIDSFNKLKIDKSKPTADLYDLLFYLEQRDNNGNTYKVRAQVLFDIVGHLRNKNWPAAFQLVKDRLKALDTTYSAGLEFFGKTQNVVGILKGIVNRFETIEAFEKHAQGFLQNIDQVKYKILKDQGLVSENSASSSNNNTNGLN